MRFKIKFSKESISLQLRKSVSRVEISLIQFFFYEKVFADKNIENGKIVWLNFNTLFRQILI